MSAKIIKTGGGTFDPNEQNIYFIASNTGLLQVGQLYHDYLLIAVNEITSDTDTMRLQSWIDNKKKVFIDSGVYNLAMEHAKKHGLTHDEGLATPIEQIGGFNALLEKYITLIRRIESQVWGYIEIDLGGREQKIKTRTMLEGLGLRPIPVYHPFSDGWDYFDYLAERYDRICFGNIVQADGYTRKRLLATMWERHKKYPHLWVHLLGLTPNQDSYAYPANSGDSSSWLSSVRWANGYVNNTALRSFGKMDRAYKYKYGETSPDRSEQKAVSMSAYGQHMDLLNWRNHLESLRKLGFPVYE